MVGSVVDYGYTDDEYADECPDLSLLARRPCWQRQASCRGTDTDLWFPVSGTSQAAKAVCEACPVRSRASSTSSPRRECCKGSGPARPNRSGRG
jgi:hypothetical protein